MFYKVQSDYFYNDCLNRISDIIIPTKGDDDKRTIAKHILDGYISRTILHINLVMESASILADHICSVKNINKETFFEQVRKHDIDKLDDGDMVVYYAVACDKLYNPPTNEYDVNNAVLDRFEMVEWPKHYKRNMHHVDRFYGTKMDDVWKVSHERVPMVALGEMVADWTAMWLEKGNASPSEWLKKNQGTKFEFDSVLLELVYNACKYIEGCTNQLANIRSKYNLPAPSDVSTEGLSAKDEITLKVWDGSNVADLEHLQEASKQAAEASHDTDDFDPNYIAEHIKKFHGTGILFMKGTECIGACEYHKYSNYQKNPDPYKTAYAISTIAVFPKYRGKGYAYTAMMLLLEKMFKSSDLPVTIGVVADNTPAVNLYKKCGFTIVNTVVEGKIKCYLMGMQKRDWKGSTSSTESVSTNIYYRVTYDRSDTGIYEALKNSMTEDEWMEFKHSSAATWLPLPSVTYKKEYKSYFTQLGYNEFIKKVRPYIVKHLDVRRMRVYKYVGKKFTIVYADKYQIVTDGKDPIPSNPNAIYHIYGAILGCLGTNASKVAYRVTEDLPNDPWVAIIESADLLTKQEVELWHKYHVVDVDKKGVPYYFIVKDTKNNKEYVYYSDDKDWMPINTPDEIEKAKEAGREKGLVEEQLDFDSSPATEALATTITSLSQITNVDELKRFFRECKYGLIDFEKGKPWRDTHTSITDKDYINYWRLLTPEQIVKYKCGICYDLSQMTDVLLTKWHIEHKRVFAYCQDSDTESSDPTHDFCVYKDNDGNSKRIDFPESEIETIPKQDVIITTRVNADYARYQKGDFVKTSWGQFYQVVDRIEISKIQDHPYFGELTPRQIAYLSKYKQIAVLKLKRNNPTSVWRWLEGAWSPFKGNTFVWNSAEEAVKSVGMILAAEAKHPQSLRYISKLVKYGSTMHEYHAEVLRNPEIMIVPVPASTPSTESIPPEEAEKKYSSQESLGGYSVEAFLSFPREAPYKEIEKRAKSHYKPVGQNSWMHIQQVYSQATRACKFIEHRTLNLKEFAAIMFHDSSVLTDTDKKGHNIRGAEIAKQELKDLFAPEDLEEIATAIVEHDGSTKWSTLTSDLLATGDANPPDPLWACNKSYSWGIKNGLTHEERIKNVITHMPKQYGSKGSMVYPPHYSKYFSTKIKEMQVYFDNLTYETAERDIMTYRKKHHLGPTDIKLPEPSVESLLSKSSPLPNDITSVDDLKQKYKSVRYGLIDYSVKPPVGVALKDVSSMEEFGEKWQLTSPEDLFKYGYGNCVNTAYASDAILTSLQIQHTVYCMFTEDIPGGHMFVVYKDMQGWRWIEASFDPYNDNNLTWSTEQSACLDICAKVAKYLNAKKYSVWEFTSFPPEGSGIQRLVLLTYIPMIKLHRPVYTNGNGKGLLNWENKKDENSDKPGLIHRIANSIGFSNESIHASMEDLAPSDMKPLQINREKKEDRFKDDKFAIEAIDEKTLNMDIVHEIEKRSEHLEVLKHWVTTPDYTLVDKLAEFGAYIDEIYKFDKPIIAYRGMRVGIKDKPLQNNMGIIDVEGTDPVELVPKPGVVPGYKFTYTTTGPLSVSRSVWLSKIYGDCIVKTVVPHQCKKLVITNELAYILQKLDEKYPEYRPINLSARLEVILLPNQTLNYEVVTTTGDITSEMPEFKDLDYSNKKVVLDPTYHIGVEQLSNLLLERRVVRSSDIQVSEERLEIRHEYIMRKLREGKRCTAGELREILQPGDILIPYPRDKKQSDFMKLFHAVERGVYGMSFTSCKLMHDKETVIGYGVKNKIERGKSAFDKTTINKFLEYCGGVMVLRLKRKPPESKMKKLHEFMERYYKDAQHHDFSFIDATLGTLAYIFNVGQGELDPKKLAPEDYNKLVCSSVVAGAFYWAGIDLGLPKIKINRIMPIHMCLSDKLTCVASWFARGEWNPTIEQQLNALELQESSEALSMEALSEATIMSRKKMIIEKICKICDIMDPSHLNSNRYHKLLDNMSAKDFNQWMTYVREGKWLLHIVVPNMIISLRNENLLKAADALNLNLFHRIWMVDANTGRKFLTDNAYLVLPEPIRRQQQFLKEKSSYPADDKHIDGMTGQVTGESKATQITNPEINILAFRGLDVTLEEMVNIRGGNMVAYGEFKKQAEETGEINLSELDPNSRSRTAVIAQVLLNAMHIETNIV